MTEFLKNAALILMLHWTISLPGYAANVSTSSPEATQAAMAILKAGGNAVDAACGAVFVLNVSQPHFSGMGGGGFALIHDREKGDVYLDFRESAPAAINSQLFYQSNGSLIPGWGDRNTGPRAVGVPGVVAGCGQAVRENGKLPWKKVLEPAIRLANEGFVISQFFQEELSDQWKRISAFDFSKALLQGADNGGLKKGEFLKQPVLAETLKVLAEKGPENFYSGELSQKWLKESQEFGIKFTQSDLENYRVYKRDLISFDFGKYHGVTVSAPSSAGLTVAAVLRYLDHYFSTHSNSQTSLIDRYVLAIETKSYFAKMRDKNLADPTRMKFNLLGFIGSRDEVKLWKSLDSTISARLKKTTKISTKQSPLLSESLDKLQTHTAHVSVVDDFGNAAALTSSVGNIFGSGIILPQSGFVLNSTLGDFTAEKGQVNSPGALFRPLSNMSPTLIFEGKGPDQKLIGVVGAAGGPLIPSGIVDFIQNYYFYNMDRNESIRFPRIHSENGIDVDIEKNAPGEVIEKLSQLGYRVKPIDTIWAVFEAVVRKTATQKWETIAETRYDGLGLSSE